MASSEWQLSLKLMEQPKSTFHFPEMMPGDVSPGEYRVATLKQLVAAQLPDSVPDPDLIELVHCGRKLKDDLTLDACGILSGSTIHILKETWPDPESSPEPVNRATAAREFRVFHAALHSLNSTYRDSVYKMLTNKESLDQIIVLRRGPLRPSGPGSPAGQRPLCPVHRPEHAGPVNRCPPGPRQRHHPGAALGGRQHACAVQRQLLAQRLFRFLQRYAGLHVRRHVGRRGGLPSSRGPRQDDGLGGDAPGVPRSQRGHGPRPITQSELATALALATRPKAAPSLQPHPTSNAPPMPAGTPVSNDLFSQALQQALQASNMSALQGRWQSQMQQLRDMGIQDEELTLRALQATDGDIQAALELIFAGG
ncbi:unnamed protein product, partial [Tetraodon nigroviridis]